ncbi:MAG: twin-arginine translocase subunit TatC [Chloroflexales bacterium]|nr:twin-arginine translocase subunit TatC [Chloroflexales bacterium]
MIKQQESLPNPVGPASDEDQGMTLIEHLVELRRRLVRASLAVLAGLCVGVFLVLGPVQLIDFIILSFVENQGYPPLQGVRTTESFTSYMTVALTVGIILAMPVIVYQLLAFIVPGLTDKERRFLFTALPFVTLFFVAGLAFGWFVTVPVAIQFLINFGNNDLIEVRPQISDFLNIFTFLLIVNGIIFELPIIIYILARMGVVTAQQLSKYRRYAVVIVVIFAAIVTPTGDPVNLALLAIPTYLLFEFGILLARFVPKRTTRDM